jgi:hypothetical protein
MTTPARPGKFTGATDTASAGSYFGTTLLSGISDLVAADVSSAQTSATNASTSETNASTSATTASTHATTAQKFATNPHNTQFTHDSSNYYSALHYATEVSNQTTLATTARTDAQKFATNAANSAFTYSGSSYYSALHYSAASATSATASATSATASATSATASATSATASATSATASSNSASTSSGHATTASGHATTASNYAVKVDGVVPSTSDYSAKAWAIGGTGVDHASGGGNAKDWATETTTTADNTEYSAKEYAIGTQSGQSAGSAKQWAIGGGSGFTTSTAVAGGVYSAKYYAEQAAASADSFDDVYLGAKSSDPTQDNDGDALTSGDLYYNTGSSDLKVYSGSAWETAAVSTSGLPTAGFTIAMAIAL